MICGKLKKAEKQETKILKVMGICEGILNNSEAMIAPKMLRSSADGIRITYLNKESDLDEIQIETQPGSIFAMVGVDSYMDEANIKEKILAYQRTGKDKDALRKLVENREDNKTTVCTITVVTEK